MTLELKEFSDGEMTIALTSVTTYKQVCFYHTTFFFKWPTLISVKSIKT